MVRLSKGDLERLDRNGILYLIDTERKRLKTWSLPKHEEEEIKRNIKELEKLLELAKQNER